MTNWTDIEIRFAKSPPERQAYPWESQYYDSPDFLKKSICGFYLRKIFDSSAECGYGNNSGFDFMCNEKTYSIRVSCLVKGNNSWQCPFWRSSADFILFFGFRGKANPKLEFCLEIPRKKFSDRNKIIILDDDYHIIGYQQEFKIDSDKFQKMQEFMVAIDNKDGSKVEEILHDFYNVDIWGDKVDPAS